MHLRLLVAACLLLVVAGCAGVPGGQPAERWLGPTEADWLPPAHPRAVVVALHGFNDRKAAFTDFGTYAAQHGVAVVAYDQPGFGAQEGRGYWPGEAVLVKAAQAALANAHARWPAAPLYLMGESMGGAVAAVTAGRAHTTPLAGLILVSPAVWGGEALTPAYRLTLKLADAVAPNLKLSGAGLDILASDNIPMLRALGADPLYIPYARISTIAGLVHLMDDARAAGPSLNGPRLVLTGARDMVVPPEAAQTFIEALRPADCTAITYLHGWHLLLRDLEARRVWGDVLGWIDDRHPPSDLGRACGPQPTVTRHPGLPPTQPERGTTPGTVLRATKPL